MGCYQRSLAPSVASVTLVANDKCDNEKILGAVHRSPGIRLTADPLYSSVNFLGQIVISDQWLRVHTSLHSFKPGTNKLKEHTKLDAFELSQRTLSL